jgi:exonuclease VII small subunit
MESAAMDIIERAEAKLRRAVDDLTKLTLKRDKTLDALVKAQDRYRKATQVVSRSQRRLDKARLEQRKASKARKRDLTQSKNDTPDIASVLGV